MLCRTADQDRSSAENVASGIDSRESENAIGRIERVNHDATLMSGRSFSNPAIKIAALEIVLKNSNLSRTGSADCYENERHHDERSAIHRVPFIFPNSE